MLNLNTTPVLCAITHDGDGQLLNTNADTIASKVAQSLSRNFETHLHYIFEYPGVLKDIAYPDATFASLDAASIRKFKSDGTLSAGMIPKIDNALEAREAGVTSVSICSIQNLLSQEKATAIL